ncbi:MAG: nucleoside-triphosphatase [Prolixibacteraceae bacterium]|nr:nucleoside-triphosphatase [Prolixibacteraceae bacterium]
MIAHLSHKPVPEKWMKASVLGSLWAVVEIVLGSMLHNLKIPLAGSILSFFSVLLIVSFLQLWKENGVVWRAGLICAIMKSLSPSAIIIGPMLGIFAEALIIEIIVRCFGKNVFSYAFGGALAVFSALVHKAITLLLLYGWDLVVLFENFCAWAAKQLHIESIKPIGLLVCVSVIYLLSGILAAVSGFFAGKRSIEKEAQNQIQPILKKDVRSTLFKHANKKKHSLPLLLLILIFLIGGMVIINHSGFIISLMFTSLFVFLITRQYAHNMRYLRKPALWGQLLFLLLFSAFFYEGFSLNGITRPEGWIVGSKMIFRAMLLLSAFSAISTELKNPIIRNILYNRGIKNMYLSLELAFSALPGLMNTYSSQTLKAKGFGKIIQAMFVSSHALLNEFLSFENNRPTLYIVCGGVNQGKTAITKKVVGELQKAGLKVSGFFTTAHTSISGEKAYFVEDVSTGETKKLGSKNFSSGKIKKNRFTLTEEGIIFGKKILQGADKDKTDIFVIDEIGPLEIRDKGWSPAIDQLLKQRNTPHIWVVRKRLIKTALRKWNVGDVTILNLPDDSWRQIVEEIQHGIKTYKEHAEKEAH